MHPNAFVFLDLSVGVGDESASCNGPAPADFLLTLAGVGQVLRLDGAILTQYPIAGAPNGFGATHSPDEQVNNDGYKTYQYVIVGNDTGGAIKEYDFSLNMTNLGPAECDPYNGNATMDLTCYDKPIVINSTIDYLENPAGSTSSGTFKLVFGTQIINFYARTADPNINQICYKWTKSTIQVFKNGVLYDTQVIEFDPPFAQYPDVCQGVPVTKAFGGIELDQPAEYEIVITTEQTQSSVVDIPVYSYGIIELYQPTATLP